MLDKALEIARLEEEAMKKENYEDAILLSRQRGKIVKEAWDFFHNDFRDEYRQKLLRLHSIHLKLTEIASKAQERVRLSLQQSRNEKRRIRGYQTAVSLALH